MSEASDTQAIYTRPLSTWDEALQLISASAGDRLTHSLAILTFFNEPLAPHWGTPGSLTVEEYDEYKEAPHTKRAELLTRFPWHKCVSELFAEALRDIRRAEVALWQRQGRLILQPGDVLEVGENLMTTIRGMPLEGFKEACQNPPLTLSHEQNKKPLKPSDVITLSLQRLFNILAVLDNSPSRLSYWWKAAATELRSMAAEAADIGQRTHAKALEVILRAKNATMADVQAIEDLAETLHFNPQAIRDDEVMNKLHAPLYRLSGLEAPDGTGWTEHLHIQLELSVFCQVDSVRWLTIRGSKDQAAAQLYAPKAAATLALILAEPSIENQGQVLDEEIEVLETRIKEIGEKNLNRSPSPEVE